MLLLSVLISCGVHAQYTEDDGGIETKNGHLRYLGLGAGATYQVMNDEAISPIIYSRVSALPMLTHIKVNQTSYSEFSLRASSLKLTHNVNKQLQPFVKTQRARTSMHISRKRSGSTWMQTRRRDSTRTTEGRAALPTGGRWVWHAFSQNDKTDTTRTELLN